MCTCDTSVGSKIVLCVCEGDAGEGDGVRSDGRRIRIRNRAIDTQEKI